MEPFKTFITISIFTSAVIYSLAAPATNVIQAVTREPLAETFTITPKITTRSTLPSEGEVITLERFFRIYEDGTFEFKIVLSNGLAQFQKITNKIVDGKTIQVYEGYNSERLPDNTYRTNFYIADENGYRIVRREFDTIPPVLPPYVPHVPRVTTRIERD